jgi:hypothetical protein
MRGAQQQQISEHSAIAADVRFPKAAYLGDISDVAKVPKRDICSAAKQHARADAPADFVLFVHGVAGLSVRVLAHRLPSAIP